MENISSGNDASKYKFDLDLWQTESHSKTSNPPHNFVGGGVIMTWIFETFIMTFILKIALQDFISTGHIHVSQTIILFWGVYTPFNFVGAVYCGTTQYTQKACSFINQSSSVEVITTCRRGSRGVGGRGMGILQPPPPPGIFKIYILENNISRF